MKSFKIFALVMVISFTLSSCGVTVYSDKDNISKKIEVNEEFTAIETLGTTDVEYKPGSPSIVLYAPKEEMDDIIVFVKDGKLIVKSKKEVKNKRYESKLKVSYPNVTTFITKGTGDIDIEGTNCVKLTLSSFGTGDIVCGNSRCTILEAATKGTGDIVVHNMDCENASLESRGTGDIEVNDMLADNIIANTFGTGDITISGECKNVSKTIKGVGSINTKGLKVKK